MAVLTAAEFSRAQQELEKIAAERAFPIDYVKAQVNTAIQALEDTFESEWRGEIASAIETAVPGVFSPAQKKAIAKFFFTRKAEKE